MRSGIYFHRRRTGNCDAVWFAVANTVPEMRRPRKTGIQSHPETPVENGAARAGVGSGMPEVPEMRKEICVAHGLFYSADGKRHARDFADHVFVQLLQSVSRATHGAHSDVSAASRQNKSGIAAAILENKR